MPLPLSGCSNGLAEASVEAGSVSRSLGMMQSAMRDSFWDVLLVDDVRGSGGTAAFRISGPVAGLVAHAAGALRLSGCDALLEARASGALAAAGLNGHCEGLRPPGGRTRTLGLAAAALALAAALAASLGAMSSGADDLERVGEPGELRGGLLDLGGVGLVELVGGVIFLKSRDQGLQLVVDELAELRGEDLVGRVVVFSGVVIRSSGASGVGEAWVSRASGCGEGTLRGRRRRSAARRGGCPGRA